MISGPRTSASGFLRHRMPRSGRAAGDLEKMMFGTTRWIYALFETGEIAGLDRAMEELESVVRQIRQPQYTYVQAGFVTMRACSKGGLPRRNN